MTPRPFFDYNNVEIDIFNDEDVNFEYFVLSNLDSNSYGDRRRYV